MNTVGGIIDMDGFTVNKTFYCKELGMLKMNEESAVSYHFTIPFKWGDLCSKDRKSCAYVIKHIHKLPFHTRESLPLTCLHDIVNDFYRGIGEKAIAYKGGCLERNLLKELDIPAVNLEIFGCPKADYLFGKLPWLETLWSTHWYGSIPTLSKSGNQGFWRMVQRTIKVKEKKQKTVLLRTTHSKKEINKNRIRVKK